MSVTDNIDDILTSITKGEWAKKIIPTVKELNETIEKNSKLSASLYDDKIHEKLGMFFEASGMPKEEAFKMAKSVNSSSYEKDIKNLSDSISKYTDKPVDKVIDRAKNITEKELKTKINVDDMSIGNKVMKYPRAYFNNPDKEIASARKTTAIGGYAAVTIGGRYVSGGSLTKDEYGRNNIAGIPFL